MILLKETRLELSTDIIKTMDLSVGDRISIQYWTENNELTFPIIGKAETFGTEQGNKLTKKQTVSFRGNQNKTLAFYGSSFTIEQFKPNIWRLISTERIVELESIDFEKEIKDFEIFVESGSDYDEIDELFNLI